MDNLTHSMTGAVLGQMGLKHKSGLGMPTIIIAANIPDIDATCALLGTQTLALRRGISHGPIALILLPLVLTAIMFGVDRWQASRGTRPEGRKPVHFLWLWLIAQIGTLSHPALDWMNSYGIRLLSPFSDEWFHGDTLFIIDVWLWALLIGGYVWARRGDRLPVSQMMRRARIIFTVACAYIFANGAVTGSAEAKAAEWLRTEWRTAELVVANPRPLMPWRREMLWRGEGHFGSFPYSLVGGITPAAGGAAGEPTGMEDPVVETARRLDRDAGAFLFWARMPVARRDQNGDLILTDQRFAGRGTGASFTVRVPAELLR